MGVIVENTWGSDAGGVGNPGCASWLDQCERSEVVAEHQRDQNAFGVGGGFTSGYYPAYEGVIPPTLEDTHVYARGDIHTAGLSQAQIYTLVYKQLFQFTCNRCGAEDAVCTSSGFHVTHRLKWNPTLSRWTHKTTKAGYPVAIGDQTTGPGAGSASSEEHPLF